MPSLPSRIPFTTSTDVRLKALRARTSVTPNLSCRVGFCLSLLEPGDPPSVEPPFGREINRHTLFGDYEPTFLGLLRTWMIDRGLQGGDGADLGYWLVAHMNRGVDLVSARVKTVADFGRI